MVERANDLRRGQVVAMREREPNYSLHPTWRSFIEYCVELQHGEIDKLKIQNGLPLIAERGKKKIKFTSLGDTLPSPSGRGSKNISADRSTRRPPRGRVIRAGGL